MTVVNVVVPEGGGRVGVPYRAQCSSAVKVRGFPLQMDVQGFNCFPSRMVGLHMLDCCCFPVHLVLFGPCVYCDAVLHIVSLHCSFVFTYPLLQCSSYFSDVDTLAFSTWYLVPGTRLLSQQQSSMWRPITQEGKQLKPCTPICNRKPPILTAEER